jgi:hypothetical protein
VPYKGVKLRGVVDDDYIYATLLSKHLIPFGYEKLHMVALPARLHEEGKLMMLEREDQFAERGHFDSWEWFAAAAQKWEELRKQDTTKLTFAQQLNYRNKLTSQNTRHGYKVLYNHSGTHISACVLDIQTTPMQVYGRTVTGIVIDVKTYFIDVETQEEGHYLSSILNAESVDKAIKAYQTRGIYKGERDVHRTPFEACEIPPFDSNNADHCKLARLSMDAHQAIEMLKVGGGLKGDVYKLRDQARTAVKEQRAAIDEVTRRVLGL